MGMSLGDHSLRAYRLLDKQVCHQPRWGVVFGYGRSVLERELASRSEFLLVAALWLDYGIIASIDEAGIAMGVSRSSSDEFCDLCGGAVLL
jgi:hypothetical protein